MNLEYVLLAGSSVDLLVGLSCFLCPVLFACRHLTSRIFSVYKVGAKVRLENTHDAEWKGGESGN